MAETREKKIPVFITHAWRFHDDWNRLAQMIEQFPGSPWVNYSVPWYDPAIRVHSDAGKEKLTSILLAQIIPAKFLIFLCGPYSAKSAHIWFDKAVDIALERNKEILLLPGYATQEYLAPDRIADARRISWDLEKVHKEIVDNYAL
ncbi:hypothetical protein EOI86_10420 [Hwanghaeella grinnelliae]|uniref:Thoeris protein ThsB TIR-like domain-containing protein n=1 Tax=Hwanghaeella grinnelliae TaxID=2500179 RepID=A0A437QYN7_9PROT|nr:TIR domain-containing protein [Hwanghaeella grinnelliae]RVU39614.1 hypothetical protein EOI86_10420 [Hwanghaeella grinnelliae]